MQAFETWMRDARGTLHPVEYAAMLHLKLATIHPFIDGNGRTARLMMNLALLQEEYMLGIIPPSCRTEYNEAIRTYQNSGRQLGARVGRPVARCLRPGYLPTCKRAKPPGTKRHERAAMRPERMHDFQR